MTNLTQTTQPNGSIAYTVERPEQVADLPYYYLCAISDQTKFVYPHKTTQHWMAGPFTVLGLVKAGRRR